MECSISARELSWDWLGDCHDRYSIGDRIMVRVQKIDREDIDRLAIKADVRSIVDSDMQEKLSQCKIQSKYAGVITDIRNGTMYIRLSNGVNAIARTCYDSRTPCRKDEVSFVITKINFERSVAFGIVSRIIRQGVRLNNYKIM